MAMSEADSEALLVDRDFAEHPIDAVVIVVHQALACLVVQMRCAAQHFLVGVGRDHDQAAVGGGDQFDHMAAAIRAPPEFFAGDDFFLVAVVASDVAEVLDEDVQAGLVKLARPAAFSRRTSSPLATSTVPEKDSVDRFSM